MAASNVETFSKFLCMICFESPTNPEHCFQCSQFVCKSCIDVIIEILKSILLI